MAVRHIEGRLAETGVECFDKRGQEGVPRGVRKGVKMIFLKMISEKYNAWRRLRPCVIYRKITNGFRSEWGAALYADIRSVVETARRRSIRAIDAIRLTLESKPIPCVA